MFEIKEKDLVARIGLLETNHGTIQTPALLPVINPSYQMIDDKELTKAGAEIVITNAYILWKNFKDETKKQGVRKFIKSNKAIMTDSGAFQLMEYGDVEISNEEVIEFEKKIDTDIGIPLDVPTMRTERKYFQESVEKSIERAKEALKFTDKKRLWCGPVQGAGFTDLVEKSAKEMAKLNYDLYAVGSVVPWMEKYEYSTVIDALATAKNYLPAAKPVHLFGAGHPMFFAFACAFGADLFDSAAYALYAKDGRYMTVTGTKHVDDLEYLPCNCPVCSSNTAGELKNSKKLIALHNLYASFEELSNVKQAIKENTLWDLLEQRAKAHPKLNEIFKMAEKHKNLLLKNDPLTKRRFFYFGENSKLRPEFQRVKEMTKKITGSKAETIFGKVPATLLDCYPFSNVVSEKEPEKIKQKNIEKQARDMSKYWFGYDLFPKYIKIIASPKTDRMRQICSDTKTLCSVDPTTYKLLLHESAKTLHSKTKNSRIMMKNDAVKFILDGKSAFCKFVKDCSDDIIPGKEILIVDEKDRLLAAGDALYSADETLALERGIAAKIRWINK